MRPDSPPTPPSSAPAWAGFFAFLGILFLLSGAVLPSPTICMGGMLPVLARLVEEEPLRPGRFIGAL